MIRIIRKGVCIRKVKEYKLIISRQPVAPFSWMNYIIISQKDWKEYGPEILIHEQGHILAGHSWDLIFLQLFVIFHWFNPAIWLIKRELQNIHEFEADRFVLDKGIDTKLYQLLLIKKAVGTQRFLAMTNSFNHSKLKKRIIMMLKNKTNPWACLKYMYILPVSVRTVFVWSCSEVSEKLTELAEIELIETNSGTEFYSDSSFMELFADELSFISVNGTSFFIENAKAYKNANKVVFSGTRFLLGEEPDHESEKDKLKLVHLINPPRNIEYWEDIKNEASFILNGDSMIFYIFTAQESLTMKVEDENLYKITWKEKDKQNNVELYFDGQQLEKFSMSPAGMAQIIPSREYMEQNNEYSPFYHRNTF